MTTDEINLNEEAKLTQEEVDKKCEYLHQELREALGQYLYGHPSGIQWIDDIVYQISLHLSLTEGISTLEEKREIIYDSFKIYLPCIDKDLNDFHIVCKKCPSRSLCHKNWIRKMPDNRQQIIGSIDRMTETEHNDFFGYIPED